MQTNLKEYLRQIRREVGKNTNVLPKLIELRKDVDRAFDEHIESILAKNNLIKQIRVPKIKLPLWKYKGKRIELPFNWKYTVSTPFIYGMVFPTIVFHIGIEVYHQICFRLYNIPIVDYRKYFAYDRQLLSMLNPIEKINCLYCSYVNNLIRYSAEIGGRTERYWCPIKYFRRINNPHSQYSKFVSKKDFEDMKEKWEELRDFSDIK